MKDDGRIRYYGPSIAEYGQLLHTAALLEERAGPADWWADGFKALDRIAEYLLRLRAAAGGDGLISGVPEADTRADTGPYFHNNAWVVKGLGRWAELCGAGTPPRPRRSRRPGSSRKDSPKTPSGPSSKPGRPIPPTGGCRRGSGHSRGPCG